MSAVFKTDETFRDDFKYSNSPAAIRRFPLPFSEDKYMYSVNIEPHVPGPIGSVTEFQFDVDEHYIGECRDHDLVLKEDPRRYQALPHMMSAQWDVLECTERRVLSPPSSAVLAHQTGQPRDLA